MSSKLDEKILQAATECFADGGFHGCTTKTISARADCTEGSLFRLFGSKEKLFEATLRRAFELSQAPHAELARVLDNEPNFERGVRKSMLMFFDDLDEQYLRLATFAFLERPTLAREVLSEIPSSVTRSLAHTIQREIYRGNLRDDIDPVTAALQLRTSIWQLAFICPVLPPSFKLHSKESRRGAVKNFVEIWFHGMQKQTSKTPRKNG